QLNERTYIFDVYRMDSALGAFGIFSVRKPAFAPLVGRVPYSSFTSYLALIAWGPYLFEISAYESGEHTAAEMAELAALACARIDSSTAASDLTGKQPFQRLPIEGRQPGTERLARGPLGLRAALGAGATGSLYEAIEAVQLAMDENRTKTDTYKPHVARGSGTKRAKENDAPWWVICGYHPQEASEDAYKPATLVALLVQNSDPSIAVAAAERAATAISGAEALDTGQGWFWIGSEQPHGCVIRRGTDLIFASSKLSAPDFRTWIARLPNP
ncbi:DUF6599 family protein, partial [Candidatus Eisenbacteria bacterium]